MRCLMHACVRASYASNHDHVYTHPSILQRQNSTFANASFPMDAAHGFGIPQPVVWNGYMADAAGNCAEGVRMCACCPTLVYMCRNRFSLIRSLVQATYLMRGKSINP